jgi:hypothetical protein
MQEKAESWVWSTHAGQEPAGSKHTRIAQLEAELAGAHPTMTGLTGPTAIGQARNRSRSRSNETAEWMSTHIRLPMWRE